MDIQQILDYRLYFNHKYESSGCFYSLLFIIIFYFYFFIFCCTYISQNWIMIAFLNFKNKISGCFTYFNLIYIFKKFNSYT